MFLVSISCIIVKSRAAVVLLQKKTMQCYHCCANKTFSFLNWENIELNTIINNKYDEGDVSHHISLTSISPALLSLKAKRHRCTQWHSWPSGLSGCHVAFYYAEYCGFNPTWDNTLCDPHCIWVVCVCFLCVRLIYICKVPHHTVYKFLMRELPFNKRKKYWFALLVSFLDYIYNLR